MGWRGRAQVVWRASFGGRGPLPGRVGGWVRLGDLRELDRLGGLGVALGRGRLARRVAFAGGLHLLGDLRDPGAGTLELVGVLERLGEGVAGAIGFLSGVLEAGREVLEVRVESTRAVLKALDGFRWGSRRARRAPR